MKKHIDSVLKHILYIATREGVFRNCEVCIRGPFGEIYQAVHAPQSGIFTLLPGPRKYDIASVTKLILTVLTFRMMSVRNDVYLDTRVADILGLRGAHVDALTVRHLLCFMGRFNLFMTPDAYQKASVNFKHFMAGVKWTGLKHLEHSYTNIHAILLGIFLEMIEFKPPLELESPLEEHSGLASLFKKYLVDPLGLKGTVLEHVPVLHNAVVSLPGLRPGEPSDSVARKTLGLHKRLLGSAGVFTTVHDLAEILEVVLQGELHPTCPIRREFADMVSVPCDEHGSYGHGAGLWHRFRENLEDVQPTSPPKDAIFKSGWAGSFVFGSRSQKVSVSICTDYAFHNHDKPERKKMLHRFYASVVELALRSCQG